MTILYRPKITFIYFLLFVFLCAAPGLAFSDILEEALPLTFSDCYALALKQSELIAIDTELIKEAEAHFMQALSAYLPHVSFNSLDAQGVFKKKSSDRSFYLKQTLFDGFRGLAGMKASTFQKGQRKSERLRQEQLLLLDVANAFFLLAETEEDLKTLYIIKDAYTSRITYLEERERLGRSRLSEVMNAKVELYNVEAEIETVKSKREVVRHLLEFLVGRPVSNISYQDKELPALKDENFYVAQIEKRPDVIASNEAWKSAREKLMAVNANFWPQVSIEGNYYTQRSLGNREYTQLTPNDKDARMDGMLIVEVPIFMGGEYIALSKEYTHKLRESKLEYQRTKRLAREDIRDAYTELSSSIFTQEFYHKALESAKENYELQKKDYELNLVNNLDVLAAINLLHNSYRSYIYASYAVKRLYVALYVAIGAALEKEVYETF